MSELALCLHGYYDDFQVTNALGSKTKKHKLGKISSFFSVMIFSYTVLNYQYCTIVGPVLNSLVVYVKLQQ